MSDNEVAGGGRGMPRKLDTMFLTGPGGRVFEVPIEAAERYVITMDRMREIGHLPITPYGQPAAGGDPDDEEVGGRHQVMLASGALGYHSDVQYGAFIWTDGHTYIGDHYHPYNTELGFTP